ncbi:sulfotransferase domain-containing protein [Dactylosporangium sp. CA-152071]|uniref:sulfotransferase domain-containing protein n=1 Tax=Dactylosporangium sp. CA-152071 TaxID=3239933 RepID=UPI003D92CBCF
MGDVYRWPTRDLRSHYLSLFNWLAQHFGGRITVERSGYSYRWLTHLRRTFPEGRYIHLYRNGPDCALSMSRHAGFRCLMLRRMASQLLGIDDFDLTAAHAPMLPAGLAMAAGHHYSKELLFDESISIESFGLLWSELVCEGVRQLQEFGQDSVLHVSYEALVANPAFQLERMVDFIGAAPTTGWIERSSSLLSNHQAGNAVNLPAAEYAALRRACAAGAEAIRAIAGC